MWKYFTFVCKFYKDYRGFQQRVLKIITASHFARVTTRKVIVILSFGIYLIKYKDFYNQIAII